MLSNDTNHPKSTIELCDIWSGYGPSAISTTCSTYVPSTCIWNTKKSYLTKPIQWYWPKRCLCGLVFFFTLIVSDWPRQFTQSKFTWKGSKIRYSAYNILIKIPKYEIKKVNFTQKIYNFIMCTYLHFCTLHTFYNKKSELMICCACN